MPVTGVFLTAGQGEYGLRRLHDLVTARLRAWLATKHCAPLELETRLDSKVTAQAAAWNWPAVLAAEQTVDRGLLDELWDWCRSAAGRARAAVAATHGAQEPGALLDALVRAVRGH